MRLGDGDRRVMSGRDFSYCLQVVPAASAEQGAVVFTAPPGWDSVPGEMWPIELQELMQLAGKVVRRPAVLVVWRKELPAPTGGDDTARGPRNT